MKTEGEGPECLKLSVPTFTGLHEGRSSFIELSALNLRRLKRSSMLRDIDMPPQKMYKA